MAGRRIVRTPESRPAPADVPADGILHDHGVELPLRRTGVPAGWKVANCLVNMRRLLLLGAYPS
jgi:hypothetical protein